VVLGPVGDHVGRARGRDMLTAGDRGGPDMLAVGEPPPPDRIRWGSGFSCLPAHVRTKVKVRQRKEYGDCWRIFVR